MTYRTRAIHMNECLIYRTCDLSHVYSIFPDIYWLPHVKFFFFLLKWQLCDFCFLFFGKTFNL